MLALKIKLHTSMFSLQNCSKSKPFRFDFDIVFTRKKREHTCDEITLIEQNVICHNNKVNIFGLPLVLTT